MKKPRSKKKIIISVLCVLLALAVLTPCVINAVVMLSAHPSDEATSGFHVRRSVVSCWPVKSR